MSATSTQMEKVRATPRPFFERFYPYGFVLPALVVIALFTIYPMLYALRISAFQYVLTKPNSHPFIGFKNFEDVVTSYYFKTALINTSVYTIASVSGVILFGLLVAFLLNSKIRSVNALKIIILLPWAIPAVVAGLMWKWILNSDFGIFNAILYSLGAIDSYIPFLADPNLAKLSLILAHIWKEGPLAAIFLLGGLQLIPNEYYEPAKIDGGSSLSVFASLPSAFSTNLLGALGINNNVILTLNSFNNGGRRPGKLLP